MKRVFLSFSKADAGLVEQLLGVLQSPEYELLLCDAQDAPLNASGEEARAFRQRLGSAIAQCSVTVCLVGEETHKCAWVACHLEKSFQKGSRMIFMALPGIKEAVLPVSPQVQRVVFYPWDPAKLARLISEEKA